MILENRIVAGFCFLGTISEDNEPRIMMIERNEDATLCKCITK